MNGLINDINLNIIDLEYSLSQDGRIIRNSKSLKELQTFNDTFGYY